MNIAVGFVQISTYKNQNKIKQNRTITECVFVQYYKRAIPLKSTKAGDRH